MATIARAQARAASVWTPGIGFDYVTVLVSSWLLFGLGWDGWAHGQGLPDSFWTVWHLAFYSGFAANGRRAAAAVRCVVARGDPGRVRARGGRPAGVRRRWRFRYGVAHSVRHRDERRRAPQSEPSGPWPRDRAHRVRPDRRRVAPRGRGELPRAATRGPVDVAAAVGVHVLQPVRGAVRGDHRSGPTTERGDARAERPRRVFLLVAHRRLRAGRAAPPDAAGGRAHAHPRPERPGNDPRPRPCARGHAADVHLRGICEWCRRRRAAVATAAVDRPAGGAACVRVPRALRVLRDLRRGRRPAPGHGMDRARAHRDRRPVRRRRPAAEPRLHSRSLDGHRRRPNSDRAALAIGREPVFDPELRERQCLAPAASVPDDLIDLAEAVLTEEHESPALALLEQDLHGRFLTWGSPLVYESLGPLRLDDTARRRLVDILLRTPVDPAET